MFTAGKSNGLSSNRPSSSNGPQSHQILCCAYNANRTVFVTVRFGVILNVPKRIWINQYLSWICCLVMRMMSIICNSVKLGVGGFSMDAATALYSAICLVSGNYGKGNLYSVNLSAIVGQSVWLPCSRNLRN
ncbi:uncharacterized protein LOC142622770 isoform X2 [Castanea sativa]|uniref:uncharacterized protein LOC142622770 isoform X2 n=1 Tax=Castanea sativa TaxID=21020 RepID=UPI003F653BE7